MKVLFICVDGADKNLILNWANSGFLPTFNSLLKQGAVGTTIDPPGINGCHWPTFFSGACPATHGRYWAQQIQLGTYNVEPFTFDREPFWNVLSNSGRKVILIDAPEAPLSEESNQIQIAEGRASSLQIHPSSLFDEIKNKFGEHFGSLRTTGRSVAELKSFRENLKSSVEKRVEIGSYLLSQFDWDFSLISFRESHWVGHQCWHLVNSSHPEYEKEVVESLGNPVRDIYATIDSAIGRILEIVDSETIVFVLASTGMESNFTGVHILDEILMRLEAPRQAIRVDVRNSKTLNFLKQYKAIRDLKRQVESLIKPPKNKQKQLSASSTSRKFFQVPSTEAYGGIRVNLFGREPNGRVRVGKEYEEICKTLTLDLLDIVNVKTGEPVVRQVHRLSNLDGQSEYSFGYPDLLVEWNRDAPIASVFSQKIGRLDKVYWDSRTGDHKPGGFFIALGSSIYPRRIEQHLSVVDFAPTIANLLGVKLVNSDGRCVSEILTSEPSQK